MTVKKKDREPKIIRQIIKFADVYTPRKSHYRVISIPDTEICPKCHGKLFPDRDQQSGMCEHFPACSGRWYPRGVAN